MKRLRICLALCNYKGRYLIILFSTIAFLLNTGGCQLFVNPDETLTWTIPTSGVLVIGQNDTLYGTLTTHLGFTLYGGCLHEYGFFEAKQDTIITVYLQVAVRSVPSL